MKFDKFTSIEQHYREKVIYHIRDCGYDNIRYIAHEKIDGANFSFITDGKEVQVASRSQIVDGTFYHCQSVIDKYSKNIINLKNEEYPDAEQIQVYGELFGPGIQNRVFYGVDKEFMAFDINVDGVPDNIMSIKVVLAVHDIPQVPLIGIYNSLDEALNESNVFNSKVYDIMNKQESVCEYEEGENVAEGIVIQPLDTPLFLNNNSRVILKSKNDIFTEKNKNKNKDSNKTVHNPFVEIAEPYVNENRLLSVLSKFGEPSQKDFGKIIQLMAQDVIEDIEKEEDHIPADWRKHDDYKLLGKGVNNVVSKFLKKHLLPKL